ncbi:glycosyltransferase [Candidatus Saccharibacteria bacterium]|nr:glycosyltransferase [Candidatus Saccharibacteria bacterium]
MIKKQNKNLVIYIVSDKKNAQFRYRVANPIDACKKSRKWQATFYTKEDINRLYKNLPEAKLLIIERQTSKNSEIPNLIKFAHTQGIKVLFDLDDLIFDFRDLPLLMRSTKGRNVCYWIGYFAGIRRVAKKVDGFIVTNNFLARKISRSFKKPVAIIPNSLNTSQIKVSKKYLKTKLDKKDFTLGYFSGSPTHIKDFRLVEPEIIRFLEDHDNASLIVVGYMKFSSRAKKLIKTGRIKFEPPVDYLKLQEKITKVDVNIAPLLVNDFTNCKSELKFFEAAIVETTTIASPSYTFKKAITDGKNGFLAQPGEWYKKLEYLYSHPEENKKIAKKAKEYSLKHYYGEEFLKEVEGVYDYFAK